MQSLVACVQVAVRFFAMFLHTMQREWSHIDKLRLDKFMMLIRTFFSHLFEMMAQQQWCVSAS